MTASCPDLSLALRWLLSHPEPAVRYRARLWLEGWTTLTILAWSGRWSYLASRQRPDGLWATDGRPYRPPVRMERRGRPCPWVTLRAARFVLEGARRRE